MAKNAATKAQFTTKLPVETIKVFKKTIAGLKKAKGKAYLTDALNDAILEWVAKQ